MHTYLYLCNHYPDKDIKHYKFWLWYTFLNSAFLVKNSSCVVWWFRNSVSQVLMSRWSHLGILWNYRFWFITFGVGLETLSLQQAFWWCLCCQSTNHTMSSTPLKKGHVNQRRTGFKPWLRSLIALWTSINYLTSPWHTFIICKIRAIVSTLPGLL